MSEDRDLKYYFFMFGIFMSFLVILVEESMYECNNSLI